MLNVKSQSPNIAKLLNLKAPLILASKSPRRKALMENLGFVFEVSPAEIDESVFQALPPREQVVALAESKARKIAENIDKPALVIGADTMVVKDEKILNKPADKAEARRMLAELSGATHSVFTGIALAEAPTGRSVSAAEETEVTFRKLSPEEIFEYAETGSPLDKAGAYGVQDDFGSVFTEKISGCYYNVVGLPLQLLYITMRRFLNE